LAVALLALVDLRHHWQRILSGHGRRQDVAHGPVAVLIGDKRHLHQVAVGVGVAPAALLDVAARGLLLAVAGLAVVGVACRASRRLGSASLLPLDAVLRQEVELVGAVARVD